MREAPGDRCVEFGAGQGHLGLLVARARPDVRVTLVEIKEYSCEGARTRAEQLSLPNCAVFCGSVDEYAASGDPFDCAIGLRTAVEITSTTSHGPALPPAAVPTRGERSSLSRVSRPVRTAH